MYCCFVKVFGENKRRLHDYTVCVQCISKKSPLFFSKLSQKPRYVIPKLWSNGILFPYQIAGAVIPLYHYTRVNRPLQLLYSVPGGLGFVKTLKINHSVKSGLIAPILQEKHKKCCCRADCGDRFSAQSIVPFAQTGNWTQDPPIAGRLLYHLSYRGLSQPTKSFWLRRPFRNRATIYQRWIISKEEGVCAKFPTWCTITINFTHKPHQLLAQKKIPHGIPNRATEITFHARIFGVWCPVNGRVVETRGFSSPASLNRVWQQALMKLLMISEWRSSINNPFCYLKGKFIRSCFQMSQCGIGRMDKSGRIQCISLTLVKHIYRRVFRWFFLLCWTFICIVGYTCLFRTKKLSTVRVTVELHLNPRTWERLQICCTLLSQPWCKKLVLAS